MMTRRRDSDDEVDNSFSGDELGSSAPISLTEATPPKQIPEFWRCFHCDFHTTDRAEAEAHFGERDDAEEFKPICKWWANMDDAERRSALQDAVREWKGEQQENDRLKEELQRVYALVEHWAGESRRLGCALTHIERSEANGIQIVARALAAKRDE